MTGLILLRSLTSFSQLDRGPTKAFHSQQAQGYKDYMVTVEEFNRSIEQLYQNDFVLVNLNDLIQKTNKGIFPLTGLRYLKEKTINSFTR